MSDTEKILQSIAGLTQKVNQQGKILTGLTATVGTILDEHQAQRIDIRSLHDELHAAKEELKSEILSSRATQYHRSASSCHEETQRPRTTHW
jgi:regulator of replication initiation timing